MVRLLRLFSGILLAGFLVSCGNGASRWGVVLWPEAGSPVAAGEVFAVVRESEAARSVTFAVGDTEAEVDTWRAALLDSRDAAEAFAERFEPWLETYALSLRTALPLRERADRTSTRVYRLRDGEVVKVIDRLDEQSDEAGLIGYWYQVLTEEGVTGWVFGYYLELTGSSGRPLVERDDQNEGDRLVRDIAAQVWRPEAFRDMVADSRINLSIFDPRYGLFGSFEDQTFRIRLPDFDQTFTYDGYQLVQRGRIEFTGADLTFELQGNRLVAQYQVNGRQRSSVFLLFQDDVDEIIAFERERRAELLASLVAQGSTLVSTAYGTITIGERGTVSWEGFERLVPQVLPVGFGGTASLEFSLFLGDELRDRYEGAVRMLVGGGRSASFLYTLTSDGVRFVYLPASLISTDQIVAAEPLSPLVLFYRSISD